MAKKDFSNIGTGKVYSTIADATAQPTPDAQEAQKERKKRKTYTEQEALEFQESLNTAGRKGVKMARINIAFTPDNFAFIKVMSRAAGMNQTELVNLIIEKYAAEHEEAYQRALSFRDFL